MLDTDAWEYFDGKGWVPDQAQAAEVIKPSAGEGSLVWNPGIGLWMYTTLNELSEAIELRFAERPEGPWSEPEILARGSDYAQAYSNELFSLPFVKQLELLAQATPPIPEYDAALGR